MQIVINVSKARIFIASFSVVLIAVATAQFMIKSEMMKISTAMSRIIRENDIMYHMLINLGARDFRKLRSDCQWNENDEPFSFDEEQS